MSERKDVLLLGRRLLHRQYYCIFACGPEYSDDPVWLWALFDPEKKLCGQRLHKPQYLAVCATKTPRASQAGGDRREGVFSGWTKMERSKVGGLRLVTAVELLESLRVPAVAVDNTTAAICWRNAAFKELQASFDEGISNSKDPKASDNSKSDADFLAVLKDAPSGSSRRPTSVTWRGTDVAVAWEGSVQGDSSRNEDNESTSSGIIHSDRRA